jgi:hypothetical protein
MTPEWHRARAQLLRWLGDPESRYFAKHHEILARLIAHRRRATAPPRFLAACEPASPARASAVKRCLLVHLLEQDLQLFP